MALCRCIFFSCCFRSFQYTYLTFHSLLRVSILPLQVRVEVFNHVVFFIFPASCILDFSCVLPLGSQVALVVKNPPVNAGDIRDTDLIHGLGRFPGEGNGKPLQYSCLETLMDRGTWWVIVSGITKSWT